MPYGVHDGGLGIVWMVASWAAVVAIVVVVVRAFDRSPSRSSQETRDATQVLDERFARGDISEEEYLNRKRVLQDR